jgi:hypothetical protein
LRALRRQASSGFGFGEHREPGDDDGGAPQNATPACLAREATGEGAPRRILSGVRRASSPIRTASSSGLPIPGTRRVTRVEEDTAADSIELTGGQLERLNKAAAR